jgi:hypothetical protein
MMNEARGYIARTMATVAKEGNNGYSKCGAEFLHSAKY